MKNLKILICVFIQLALLISCSPDATDPMDPKYGTPKEENNNGNEEPEPNEEPSFPNSDYTLNVADRKAINPMIFGVNNDWRQIPGSRFSSFVTEYNEIGAQLIRFPGGWESEYYDWETNTTPNWDNKPDEPGTDIESVKSNFENYSIVIPTAQAMNQTIGTEAFNAAMEDLKKTAKTAINMANPDKVKIVEIGNEWWLQWGGGVSRSEKLKKYTTIAMNLADFIGEEFPERSFKLLVNGEYTQPQEFTSMKDQFTKAYDQIDGVSLHTYVGYQTDTHEMDKLLERIEKSAKNFNPENDYIYLSEWMPSRAYNESRLYMEAANIIPDIFQIYARAGTDAAAFWPPVNVSIPGVGMFNWNYSTLFPVGQIFSELAHSFQGEVVNTTDGDFFVTAALNDDQTLVVFVPGKDREATKIILNVEGFSIDSIEHVEKFIPNDYSDTAKAEPYKTGSGSVSLDSPTQFSFVINEEGPYQIFKVVLKGKISN